MSEQTSVAVATPEQLADRVAAQEAELAGLRAQLAAIRTRKQSSRHGTWQNLTPTAILRALGCHGWGQQDSMKVIWALGFTEVTPATVSTQNGWGRQWAKGNPKCLGAKKPYGSEPAKLTEGQLAELAALRDGTAELRTKGAAA